MARGEIERRGGEGQQVMGPRGQRAFLHVESNHRRQTFFLQDQGDHRSTGTCTRTGRGPYLFIGRAHSRSINARVIQRWTHFYLSKYHLRSTQAPRAPSELRDCLGYYIFWYDIFLAGFLSVPGHCTWQCRSTRAEMRTCLMTLRLLLKAFVVVLDNTHVRVN